MASSYHKVLLLDYDNVLATEVGISKEAMERLRHLVSVGFKTAIITGRTHEKTKELTEALENLGLAEKVAVFCEHGCVRYVYEKGVWKPKIHPEVLSYKQFEMQKFFEHIKKFAGLRGMEDAVVQNVVSIYLSAKKSNLSVKDLFFIISKELEGINSSGQFRTKLVAVETRAGVEIIPTQGRKDLAAKKFLEGLKGPYFGFAFGDMLSDRKIAVGTRIKFIPVKNPNDFLQKTKNLEKYLKYRIMKTHLLKARRKITQAGRKLRKTFKFLKK